MESIVAVEQKTVAKEPARLANELESAMMRENARLRKEMARVENALEAMELRARGAEAAAKRLGKKLTKILEVAGGFSEE